MSERRLALSGLQWVAAVEATTFVVLVLLAVARRLGAGPESADLMGAVHGVAFTVLAVTVSAAREPLGWSRTRALAVVLAGMVPGAGYGIARWAGQRRHAQRRLSG